MAEEKRVKLTARQEIWCQEYVKLWNATRAAINAGYSVKTAKQMGTENLAKPVLKARVKEILEESLGDPKEKILKCIKELEMIAFSDLSDLMEWDEHGVEKWKKSKTLGEKARLISEISQTVTQHGGSKRMKLHDKRWAIEMLGKYYGFLKEHVEVSNPDGSLRPIININIPSNGREKESESDE